MKKMPVYRERSLPEGTLRGQFCISAAVIPNTRRALEAAALHGIHESGNEGLVFWAGRQVGDTTMFTTVVQPVTRASRAGVFVTEHAVGRSSRAARRVGVSILAQIHSHPGDDARHSDGDDDLIVMPFDGMLSIVVPDYGIDFSDLSNACVHQRQDARWVLCSSSSVRDNVFIVPDVVDLR